LLKRPKENWVGSLPGAEKMGNSQLARRERSAMERLTKPGNTWNYESGFVSRFIIGYQQSARQKCQQSARQKCQQSAWQKCQQSARQTGSPEQRECKEKKTNKEPDM